MNQPQQTDTVLILKKIQELAQQLIDEVQATSTNLVTGDKNSFVASINSIQPFSAKQNHEKSDQKKELYRILFDDTLVQERVLRSKVALIIAEDMAIDKKMKFEEIKKAFIDDSRLKTSTKTIISMSEHSQLPENVKWRYYQSTKAEFCVWNNWFNEQGALKEGNFKRLMKIIPLCSKYRIVEM